MEDKVPTETILSNNSRKIQQQGSVTFSGGSTELTSGSGLFGHDKSHAHRQDTNHGLASDGNHHSSPKGRNADTLRNMSKSPPPPPLIGGGMSTLSGFVRHGSPEQNRQIRGSSTSNNSHGASMVSGNSTNDGNGSKGEPSVPPPVMSADGNGSSSNASGTHSSPNRPIMASVPLQVLQMHHAAAMAGFMGNTAPVDFVFNANSHTTQHLPTGTNPPSQGDHGLEVRLFLSNPFVYQDIPIPACMISFCFLTHCRCLFFFFALRCYAPSFVSFLTIRVSFITTNYSTNQADRRHPTRMLILNPMMFHWTIPHRTAATDRIPVRALHTTNRSRPPGLWLSIANNSNNNGHSRPDRETFAHQPRRNTKVETA